MFFAQAAKRRQLLRELAPNVGRQPLHLRDLQPSCIRMIDRKPTSADGAAAEQIKNLPGSLVWPGANGDGDRCVPYLDIFDI